jgi:hypothetical protein
MAEPARRAPAADQPPLDPAAVERSYHFHRAKRRAKIERRRARKRAHLRFWLVLVLLFGLSIYLVIAVWRQIERLFGL